MDYSGLTAAINFEGVLAVFSAAAIVLLSVHIIIYGIRQVLSFVGPVHDADGEWEDYESDPEGLDAYWDGYSASDDARDRAAAGLGPNEAFESISGKAPGERSNTMDAFDSLTGRVSCEMCEGWGLVYADASDSTGVECPMCHGSGKANG